MKIIFMNDIIIWAVSLIINFLMILLFLARAKRKEKTEYFLGIIVILCAFPMIFFSLFNFILGREWPAYILLIPIIIFLILEFFFDYIYKLNFRQSRLLWLYLAFYYLGLFGLIGYAFLISRIYGYILLVFYFLNQLATWYAHKK